MSQLAQSVRLVDYDSADDERRAHRRITAADLDWLRATRVKYGPEVRLIDVSPGGLAVETQHQLKPDSTVVFELVGSSGAVLVPARVLRSQMVSLNGIALYRSACVFKKPLDVSRLAGSPAVEPSDPLDVPTSQTPPVILASAWQKVVVRYRDGRVIRGFTSDFNATRPQLHVSSDPTSGEALIVPVNQLKALFFVREFEGDPAYVELKTFADPPQGRKLEVTFEDGEVLVGSTLSYRPEGHGFFVHPADKKANNLRVFVSACAVRHVRFLAR
jgi:hypothetical protein